MTDLSPFQQAGLDRALRDLRDGHISVFRNAEGRDYADRQVAGAPKEWWNILAEQGYMAPPQGRGRWTLLRP